MFRTAIRLRLYIITIISLIDIQEIFWLLLRRLFLSTILGTIFITHLKRAASKPHIVFILLTLEICAIQINLWSDTFIGIKDFSIFASNKTLYSQISSLFSKLLNAIFYLSFFNIIFQFLELVKKYVFYYRIVGRCLLSF